MTEIRYVAMTTEAARKYWNTGLDDYGLPVTRARSSGRGTPCRHCLKDVEAEAEYLILAHCPFPERQAYAETGPVFLHANPCSRYPESAEPPAMFSQRELFLIRGYNREHRIVYGSGSVTPVQQLDDRAKTLLAHGETAYLHLRSGAYNCFQCRILRA